MKSYFGKTEFLAFYVAPARERGLKFRRWSGFGLMAIVAPARERGLKCNHAVPRLKNLKVAPARERGLKWPYGYNTVGAITCRSREGAWIEIISAAALCSPVRCRSREGAWIEIRDGGGSVPI